MWVTFSRSFIVFCITSQFTSASSALLFPPYVPSLIIQGCFNTKLSLGNLLVIPGCLLTIFIQGSVPHSLRHPGVLLSLVSVCTVFSHVLHVFMIVYSRFSAKTWGFGYANLAVGESEYMDICVHCALWWTGIFSRVNSFNVSDSSIGSSSTVTLTRMNEWLNKLMNAI